MDAKDGDDDDEEGMTTGHVGTIVEGPPRKEDVEVLPRNRRVLKQSTRKTSIFVWRCTYVI